MLLKKTAFLLYCMLSIAGLYGQSKQMDVLLAKQEYDSAKVFLDTYKKSSSFNVDTQNALLGKWHVTNRELDSAFYYLFRVDTLQISQGNLGYYWYDLGEAYRSSNEEDDAVECKLKAQKILISQGDLKKANDINYDLYYTYISQENLLDDAKYYLNAYESNIEDDSDYKVLLKLYILKAQVNSNIEDADIARHYFQKAETLNKIYKDSAYQASIHQYKRVFYQEILNKDSTWYHVNKAHEFYTALKKPNRVFTALGNKASYERIFNKNYKKAISYALQADTIPITRFIYNKKRFLYEWLSKDYDSIGDFQKAYHYLNLYKLYSDSVNIQSQNTNLTRFRTIETEKRAIEAQSKNVILENKRIFNRNIYIILSILLLAVILISFLLFQNAKRKQKLSHQEKILQEQQINQLLKDQELNGIDAMIEGQEKERQRIANDLHDNLGSLLATLKLHFQNLKVKKERLKTEEDVLLNKTDDLIEEAYQKVRGIAHARNAGVMANEGLLPAVKNFAAKVSSTNQLVIEVLDHGLEERLENSLEITLFRIIQELITNIIKHANATEASIHLTHHESSINIMVEDNGNGFDISSIKPKEGMGLYSIQKRIEYLNGTIAIDTGIGRNTSIIIDIPFL